MKKKQSDWYVSWFSTKEYLDLYKHRDEDDAREAIDLILRHVSISKASAVLDLACGNGRHSMLLAKRGFNVTGIDLSKYLISEARKRLCRTKVTNLKFKVRDMRHFSFPKKFDLIVNLFTSFGYFQNDDENWSVIECCARSLKTPGYLVVDYFNTTFLRRNIEPYSISRSRGRVFIQTRRIVNSYVRKDIFLVTRDNKKYDFRRYYERIKLYSLQDFSEMFRQNGLEVIRVFGNYDGSSFVLKKSPRLIIIGKKSESN